MASGEDGLAVGRKKNSKKKQKHSLNWESENNDNITVKVRE